MQRRALLGAALAALTLPARAATATPPDLAEPLAQYRAWLLAEVAQLVAGTRAFVAAVKAGDLDTARRLYTPTRLPWERIEPVAELFPDLDRRVDARADDYEKAEQDPEFTGFHRIEYALFHENSTAGMGPVADRLLADVIALQTRLPDLALPPEQVVGGAAELIEEVAETKISGEEERYSHTDLAAIRANVDGAQKIVALFRALIAHANAALLARIEANFTAVDTVLDRYRLPDGGFQTYDRLDEVDRNRLQGPITALAEDLSRLRGTLGLD